MQVNKDLLEAIGEAEVEWSKIVATTSKMMLGHFVNDKLTELTQLKLEVENERKSHRSKTEKLELQFTQLIREMSEVFLPVKNAKAATQDAPGSGAGDRHPRQR